MELTFLRGSSTRGRIMVDAQNTPWVPAMLSAFVALHGEATQAWYDSLDADPAQLRRLATSMARDGFLRVSLWSDGRWMAQGSVPAPGPELAKRQVIPLDLTGLAGDTVRVRLTSTPSFWWIDQAALDTSESSRSEAPHTVLLHREGCRSGPVAVAGPGRTIISPRRGSATPSSRVSGSWPASRPTRPECYSSKRA